MFADRRRSTDRRKQSLPMPAALDRRKQADGRRTNSKSFRGQPWWLSISYGEELISESAAPADQAGEENEAPIDGDQNKTNS